MNSLLTRMVCVVSLVAWACAAQVESAPPKNWTTAVSLFGLGNSRLKLPQNDPNMIRQELLDTGTMHLIARLNGLSDEDIATIRIAEAPVTHLVQLFQIGDSSKAFHVLSEKLGSYARSREEGHTKAFLLSAMTNAILDSANSDPDVRALISKRPILPVSWLKKESTGMTTNSAGRILTTSTTITIVNGRTVTNESSYVPKVDEVCRWVSYTLTDGEIGWRYVVRFKPDGAVDDVEDSKRDAKESDPQYRNTIAEVEEEVTSEMKKAGSYGRLGSVHTFWYLKKEKLKARGVDWRSPEELNPNVIYD